MTMIRRRAARVFGLALLAVVTAGGVTVQSALRDADVPELTRSTAHADLTAPVQPTSFADRPHNDAAPGLTPAATAKVDAELAALARAVENEDETTTLYRICRVTAYCDRGTTASGVQSGVGQCAAPGYVPFGSKVYIPALDRTFIVTDRTHRRFRNSTVDIFIPSKSDCVQFGRSFLEVEITIPRRDS